MFSAYYAVLEKNIEFVLGIVLLVTVEVIYQLTEYQ